jgi:hypothetical protein
MLKQARQLRECLGASRALERVNLFKVKVIKILIIEHIIAVVFINVVIPPVTLCSSRVEVKFVNIGCASV